MKTIKALIGLLLIAVFVFFIINTGKLEIAIQNWEYYRNDGYFWYNNFAVFDLIAFITFIFGGYLFFSSDTILGNFIIMNMPCDSSEINTNNKNIDDVKRYRNSKMAFMSNDDRAELIKQTGWVDGLDSYSGKRVEDTKSYINSRITFMSSESALDWLKR